MALRRWKPFLATFDHIDAAIESASDVGVPREEFKRARTRIVETLCGATDDAVAEALCRLLDDAMAESLVTLRAAGTQVGLLASGELVAAVGALASGHGSKRVRGLARDVVRGWRAAVEAELGTAMAAMHALDAASGVVFDGHGSGLDAEQRKKRSMIPEKKPTPCKTTVASKAAPAPRRVQGPSSSCCSVEEDTKKMEATKRKLHAGYQEAEDAKRRRSVQVLVVAPEMLRRQHKKTLPAVKARSPASSAAENRGRFSKSSNDFVNSATLHALAVFLPFKQEQSSPLRLAILEEHWWLNLRSSNITGV
ncbi:hypothetical protein EJB05_53733, partial [Eragrostis curvula]